MKSLRRCESGIAATEFAVITPFMLMLVVGVLDISKAVIIWHQVCNTSHAIPVSASTLSELPDKTTALTPEQAQQAMSTIYAEMPWMRDNIEKGIASVTLTAVTYKPQNNCMPTPTVMCTYDAYVVWSVAYTGPYNTQNNFDATVVRPCGILTQINPTDPIVPPATQLTVVRTKSVTQPAPILIADVRYQYTPFFTKFVTGPVNFWETGYWPVRTVNTALNAVDQYTKYDPANPADPANCPDTWDNP